MSHTFPPAILPKHLAILGMTGSGKSTTARDLVEQVVPEGSRVCILDTVKSDWWGITSSASGKRPGLPFTILGGEHGHLPLHRSMGKAIAEIVANGTLPLSIVDMEDFGPGDISHFFCDFAPMLMKKMRGVLYLLIEEAHEVAPKERAGFDKENMGVYWAKKLATAGRKRGLRLIVITQRVQALHNAVLGSCENIIVHRMTAPADQEPVVKWLKSNIKDKELRQRVEESMPSIPTGSGWLCSGENKLFELVKFPKATTYDNTAAPTNDDELANVKTAAIDIEKLRVALADAVKVANENDPALLRKQIAEMRHELRLAAGKVLGTQQTGFTGFTQADMNNRCAEFHRTGYESGFRAAVAELQEPASVMRAAMNSIGSTMTKAVVAPAAPLGSGVKAFTPPPGQPRLQTFGNGVVAVHEGFKMSGAGVSAKLSPSAEKIVAIIVRAYPMNISFDAAARRAGISKRSSAYHKYRTEVENDCDVIVDGKKLRSRRPPDGLDRVAFGDGIETWIARLPPTCGRMLRAIKDHGPLSKLQIAEYAGISPTSSGLGSGLKELVAQDLVATSVGGMYLISEGI